MGCMIMQKSATDFKRNIFSVTLFIFSSSSVLLLLMNRRLALKVFKIDKETSGLVIIKNKSLVPWWALGFIFNNHQAIGLYLLLKWSRHWNCSMFDKSIVGIVLFQLKINFFLFLSIYYFNKSFTGRTSTRRAHWNPFTQETNNLAWIPWLLDIVWRHNYTVSFLLLA